MVSLSEIRSPCEVNGRCPASINLDLQAVGGGGLGGLLACGVT